VGDAVSTAYQYALWRFVPDADRGECLNVGVVLFCRQADYLGALIALDQTRIEALAPETDLDAVRGALDHRVAVAAGDPAAGPVAELAQSERFGWLVAPASTVIQPGEVHTGMAQDPQATLEHLFRRLVLGDAPA
jgi:hypothetical protein